MQAELSAPPAECGFAEPLNGSHPAGPRGAGPGTQSDRPVRPRVDNLLAYAESHRGFVIGLAAALILTVLWIDWFLTGDSSYGFLYLAPLLLAATILKRGQIFALAIACGYLREAFDPVQGGQTGWNAIRNLDPGIWAPGAWGRLAASTAGFVMAGLFVVGLNQRRRLLTEHLKDREQQMLRQREAEQAIRTIIDTSPLAILTVDSLGRIVLANRSACQTLGSESEPLEGQEAALYLPILLRMLRRHESDGCFRAEVECRGERRNGEVFLANVWLSTYQSSSGPGLAAVIWDSSENLRDREGSGFDCMMATSRIVIGAVCHEIRNLASAASAAYFGLSAETQTVSKESYEALGSLIGGLERISASGLRAASRSKPVVADLRSLLDETRIVIEPSLREAGITVAWEAGQGLPPVQAEHHSLLQVLLNLARNSQAALESCERREIRISAAIENDLVVVRFRDTGPGVARPEELFRPFQAGSQSSGLGLYVSRAIVRSQGGDLRYEPGKEGSCFVVELWPVELGSEG